MKILDFSWSKNSKISDNISATPGKYFRVNLVSNEIFPGLQCVLNGQGFGIGGGNSRKNSHKTLEFIATLINLEVLHLGAAKAHIEFISGLPGVVFNQLESLRTIVVPASVGGRAAGMTVPLLGTNTGPSNHKAFVATRSTPPCLPTRSSGRTSRAT